MNHTPFHLMPAAGRKVRSEDGSRYIASYGEWLPDTSYYRRAFRRGDLVLATEPEVLERASDIEMQSVNPKWFTKNGALTTDTASYLIGRSVTRKEVNEILEQGD